MRLSKKKEGKREPALVIYQLSALEKLKAIRVDRRIKVSDCDGLEVKYVIWRTGEDEYKVERKRPVSLYDMMVHHFGWDFDEADFWEKMNEVEVEVYANESEPIPENFELQSYYYETIRGLTAQEVIELEAPRGFDTTIIPLAHHIELHELYEIPTEGGGLSITYELEKTKKENIKREK